MQVMYAFEDVWEALFALPCLCTPPPQGNAPEPTPTSPWVQEMLWSFLPAVFAINQFAAAYTHTTTHGLPVWVILSEEQMQMEGPGWVARSARRMVEILVHRMQQMGCAQMLLTAAAGEHSIPYGGILSC